MPRFEGFFGGSDTKFSTKADQQRTVNMHLERQRDGSRAFYRSFGIRTAYNSGLGARIRGGLELNDYAFFAIGDRLIQLDSGFNVVANLGPIANDSRRVWFAASPDSLVFASGGTLYRVNSGALTNLTTSLGLGFNAINAGFIQNYFVALSDDLRQFYFDDTDGATWDAADVQTAEADANKLVSMIIDRQGLHVFGNRISQAFLVSSNVNAPFAAQQNLVIPEGIAAAAAITTCGGYRYWIGKNRDGQYIARKSEGYDYTRCSTSSEENAWRSYGDISDAVAWSFQLNGHNMVRFTFPSANLGAGATWEYDATEGEWEEVLSWNSGAARFEAHRGYCAVSAFNKILVGDRSNGKIYEMSPDFYDDDLANGGTRIKCLRRTPSIGDGARKIEYPPFYLVPESGVGDGSNQDPNLGAVTQEADPRVTMRYSDDGGKSFSNDLMRSIGPQGVHVDKCEWNFGGDAYQRVYEVEFEAAVKFCIKDAGWNGDLKELRG